MTKQQRKHYKQFGDHRFYTHQGEDGKIVYVKETELAAFLGISFKRFRGMVGEAFLAHHRSGAYPHEFALAFDAEEHLLCFAAVELLKDLVAPKHRCAITAIAAWLYEKNRYPDAYRYRTMTEEEAEACEQKKIARSNAESVKFRKEQEARCPGYFARMQSISDMMVKTAFRILEGETIIPEALPETRERALLA